MVGTMNNALPTQTITVTVEQNDAVRLIGLAGGERYPRGGWVINGEHYWQTDEALMVALMAISDCNGIAI
jgi:hypothetical protein